MTWPYATSLTSPHSTLLDQSMPVTLKSLMLFRWASSFLTSGPLHLLFPWLKKNFFFPYTVSSLYLSSLLGICLNIFISVKHFLNSIFKSAFLLPYCSLSPFHILIFYGTLPVHYLTNHKYFKLLMSLLLESII